jgi:membrane peptidoglycan carboxypeptidase
VGRREVLLITAGSRLTGGIGEYHGKSSTVDYIVGNVLPCQSRLSGVLTSLMRRFRQPRTALAAGGDAADPSPASDPVEPAPPDAAPPDGTSETTRVLAEPPTAAEGAPGDAPESAGGRLRLLALALWVGRRLLRWRTRSAGTDPQAPALAPAAGRRRWTLRRKILFATGITVVSSLLGVSGAGGVYASGIPLPGDPKGPQASVLYYSDGHTVLARLGVANRTDVALSEVPRAVRNAVLAAEDRQFYDHFGLSLRGVARAGWADLFGGSQGASTITQQYARNAYLTQERTAGRKAKEMVLAVKLEQRYTKDEILERYLNTIYFGRNAYGIAAAARAYFGTTTGKLTVAQGAVLASVIKDPWGFDPASDEAAARGRWQWVIDAMVAGSWLRPSEAKRQTYPQVLARNEAGQSLSGPNGLVVDAVERELEARGIAPQVLRTAGLRVVTTIDAHTQQAAVDQMAALATAGADLHGALVAVDPDSGAVRAYYGGRQGQGYYDDAVAPRPPASTFKPLVLAAGLGEGISYLSRWDGSTPRVFPGRLGVPLRNQQGQNCPDCTLDESMVRSLNTPFYALAEQVGASKIRDLAVNMGVSEQYAGQPSLVDLKGDPRPGRTRPDISIGRYPVSPVDLASVYATFASGGLRANRHLVDQAVGADGEVWYRAQLGTTRVLDRSVAADVTTVLHHVAVHDGEPTGHQAAAKTGTQQWGNTSDNQDAWMAGYTPQLATVVWVGRATPGPIRDAAGAPIAGDGLPARLWRDFMTAALDGWPSEALPTPAHLGRTDAGDAGKTKRDAGKATTKPGGPTLVDHTRSGGRTLALTFDDGPSRDTGPVLDVLAQYHIKATFCMVGEQIAENRAVVARMVAEGHELCNHSMHHDDLATMTTDKIKDDLTGTITAVHRAAAGARVAYFRAPYGSWGESPAIGATLGMTSLTWTVDPEDWDTPGVDAIVAAVGEQLKPGGLVLMHDGGGDRTQTVEALKILIPRLLAAGWTFDLPAVTVAPVTIGDTDPAPGTSTAPGPSAGTSTVPTPGPSGSSGPADDPGAGSSNPPSGGSSHTTTQPGPSAGA